MPILFKNPNSRLTSETVDAFIDEIINEDNKPLSSAYLVKMSYYYDFEEHDRRKIENQLILLDYDFSWYWLNDWNEGQQNVIIYAVYCIDEIELLNNIGGREDD